MTLLEVELTGSVLTVRGERSYPYSATDDENGRDWYRLERGFGKLQRILQVPKGLDPDSITAEMLDRVLTLHIPQSEARKPRKIEITTGGSQPAIEAKTTEQPEMAGAAP